MTLLTVIIYTPLGCVPQFLEDFSTWFTVFFFFFSNHIPLFPSHFNVHVDKSSKAWLQVLISPQNDLVLYSPSAIFSCGRALPLSTAITSSRHCHNLSCKHPFLQPHDLFSGSLPLVLGPLSSDSTGIFQMAPVPCSLSSLSRPHLSPNPVEFCSPSLYSLPSMWSDPIGAPPSPLPQSGETPPLTKSSPRPSPCSHLDG